MKGNIRFKLMDMSTAITNLTNENTLYDTEGNRYVDPNRVPTNFKGLWIPKEILELDDIGDFDKMLLSEISGLSVNGVCYASNEYFSNLFNKDIRTIQRSISKLKSCEYVIEVGFDGKRRYLESNIVMTRKIQG
jgi:hypothetical protein